MSISPSPVPAPTSRRLRIVDPVELDEPSGSLSVSAAVVRVTPTLARQWLSECSYRQQRRLRPWHVDELVYALKAGQFKTGSIEFYHYQKEQFLTDGQHRLHAIVESDVPALLVVIRVHANSMEEVAAAYYRTDSGLSRPLSEAIPVSGLLEETGLTEREVQIVSSATRFVQFGFTDKASSGKRLAERNRDVRLQAVRLWGQDAREYFVAVEERDILIDKPLTTMAPVALGIVTFHYAPDQAKAFWTAVATNDGLRKGSPEHAAFNILATAAREKMALNLYARKLAYCWNAAQDGREIGSVVVRDPKKPLLLKGTPYDGINVRRYGPDMKLLADEG